MSKNGLKWTEEDLARFRSRKGAPLAINRVDTSAVAPPAATGTAAFQALGRMAKGKMNKTETAYAERLAALKHDGKILDWKFHVLRVRLADNTFYEPDFVVLAADGQISIHEVKGSFTTEKGQLKIKLCAEVLPWFRVFKCSRQKGGEWIIHEFNK